MLPISKIKVSNMFQNPLFRDGVVFVVEEINISEKMVKVQGRSFETYKPISKPFWVKNTNRMFSESWRIN